MGPAVERLIADTRERSRARLVRRERRAHLAFSAAFLVVAVALAVLAPWARGLDAGLAIALTVAYAVVARVEFAAGAGIVVPTQLVFVPMLLLLPTPLVPLLVAVAYVASDLAAAMRDRLDVERAVIAPANAWFAIAPALVLVVGDAQLPSWDHVGWYALALAAQLSVDAVLTALRARLALGLRPREIASDMLLAYRVDALLFPVGLLAAVGAASQPWAVLLVLPIVALFASFAREREARIDGALELSRAYRGTALLLGDVIEADDQYTGDHTKDVVELTVQVAEALGVDAETSPRRRVRRPAPRRGQDPHPGGDHQQAGAARRRRVGDHEDPHVEGQRMLERVGGMLARVGVVVRASHERWDGGGYPDGLAGEDIPLASRIVSVCDAYNAMTTDRSYRRALPVADAIAELERCAGTQFDPAVVAAVVAVVAVPSRPDWQLTLGAAPAAAEAPAPSARSANVNP